MNPSRILFFAFLFIFAANSIAQTERQLVLIDSLKQVIEVAEHDTIKVDAWLRWSGYINKNKRSLSSELAEKAINLSERNLTEKLNELSKEEIYFFKKASADGYRKLSWNNGYIDREKAKEQALIALELSKEITYERGIGFTYNSLGNLSLIGSELDEAIKYFTLSKEYAIKTNDEGSQGNALANLGVAYNNQGNYGKAIEYYNEGLKLAEKRGNQRSISIAKLNIGLIYFHQKEYEKALDHYRQSYDIAEEQNNKMITSSALSIMGVLYRDQNKLEEAIDVYERSMVIREEIDDKRGLGDLNSNLGEIYTMQGNYKKAMEYSQKGLAIREEIKDKERITTSLNNIGEIYRNQGNLTKAIDFSRRGFLLAKENGNKEYMRDAAEQLYISYKQKGDLDNALVNYEVFINMRDSLESEEGKKELIRQEYKYTYEKQALADSIQFAQIQQISEAELAAEKAITQQQKQRSSFLLIGLVAALGLGGYIYNRYRFAEKQKITIEENNIQLKQLNTTKDKFFGIIAHDIRSPIAALDGVGEQMNYYLQKEEKGKLERLAGRVDSTAKRLSGLLDNLLNWALLQQGVIPYHPKALKVKEVVDNTFDMFSNNAEAKNITLNSSFDSSQTVYADESAMNTILRNLVSNAIKFTSQHGTVEVNAESKADKVIFKVSDTGTGMTPKQIDQLFSMEKKSEKGTAGEKGTGLGLTLVKELVELNNGNITVSSQLNEGTTFEVTLPK